MIKCREKRDRTFGETLQEQLDKFQSQQRKTQQKLKALGPKKFTLTLTDYLNSPSRDVRPIVDMRTPTAMYLESFCQSFEHEQEEASSFLDMLNNHIGPCFGSN